MKRSTGIVPSCVDVRLDLLYYRIGWAVNAAVAIRIKVFARGLPYLSPYSLETLSQTSLRRTASFFTLFKLLSMIS